MPTTASTACTNLSCYCDADHCYCGNDFAPGCDSEDYPVAND